VYSDKTAIQTLPILFTLEKTQQATIKKGIFVNEPEAGWLYEWAIHVVFPRRVEPTARCCH